MVIINDFLGSAWLGLTSPAHTGSRMHHTSSLLLPDLPVLPHPFLHFCISATIENPFHQRLNILMVEKLSFHQWQSIAYRHFMGQLGLDSQALQVHTGSCLRQCVTNPHCKQCLQIKIVLHYCIVVQQKRHHSYMWKLSGNMYLQNVFCKLNF